MLAQGLIFSPRSIIRNLFVCSFTLGSWLYSGSNETCFSLKLYMRFIFSFLFNIVYHLTWQPRNTPFFFLPVYSKHSGKKKTGEGVGEGKRQRMRTLINRKQTYFFYSSPTYPVSHREGLSMVATGVIFIYFVLFTSRRTVRHYRNAPSDTNGSFKITSSSIGVGLTCPLKWYLI